MSEISRTADMPPQRKRIAAEAARMFRERGYDPVTLREVAEAVGLSKAGIYHYYSSKDVILGDILTLGIDLLEQQMADVRTTPGTATQRLHRFLVTRLHTIVANRDVFAVIWQERPKINTEIFAQNEERVAPYREFVRELVRQGQADGDLRTDVDPHLLMLAIDGITGWSYLWYSPDGGNTPEDIGEMFWSFIADGVAVAKV